MNMNKYKIITHDGYFHQDELIAISLIERFITGENYLLIRTRNNDLIEYEKKNPFSFVVDVGFEDNSDRLLFDHHQESCIKKWEYWKGKTNIPYSSTGLVFDYLRNNNLITNLSGDLLSKTELDYLTHNLIIPVDAMDNGVKVFQKISILNDFNIKNSDDNISFIQFNKALDFARVILDNYIRKAEENIGVMEDNRNILKNITNIKTVSGQNMVIAYANEGASHSIPYLLKRNGNIDFFVSEKRDNKYRIQTAPFDLKNSFSQKHTTPFNIFENYKNGLNIDYLTENGQVVFIHKTGFLSIVSGDKNSAFSYIRNVF